MRFNMSYPIKHISCFTCKYLKSVNKHCTTEKHKTEKGCVCNVQKGWACCPPGFPRIHDNWNRFGFGCEMHEMKYKVK